MEVQMFKVISEFVDKRSGARVLPGDPLPQGLPEETLTHLQRARCIKPAPAQASLLGASKTKPAAPARPPFCLPKTEPVPRRWPGETVVILASGPSLAAEDAARVGGKARVVAVSDAWRAAPSAELLYAADAPWWDHDDGAKHLGFAGEKWTQDQRSKTDAQFKAAARWGLRLVHSAQRAGLSFDPALIHQGGNSGFQALNLAVLFGARRILLIGFDLQPTGGRSHFFGDHPGALNQQIPFGSFRAAFEAAAPQLAEAGIVVVNCSRATALTCFPRLPLEEALAC
jgi:hypothetical protein